MKLTRSFIAIETNEEIRNSLAEVQSELGETGGDLKIVKPEKVHLTLKFLGEIPDDEMGELKETIRNVEKTGPFKMQVEGLGVFPDPGFIKVVWAGVSEGEEEAKNLQEDLEQRLSNIGYPPENREFTPHLTIARVKSGKAKDKISALVKKYSDQDFGSTVVEEIKLKKSELTPEGPIYTTLEAVEV